MGPRSSNKIIRRTHHTRPFLVLLATIALATGCAETREGPAISNAVTAVAGETLVVGRIVAVEKGDPLDWRPGNDSDSVDGDFHVLVLPKGGNAAKSYRLRGDGTFAWSMAPGEYTLAGFSWARFNRRRSDRIWMDFSVPRGGDAIYIGTLRIEASQIPASYELRDDLASALVSLETLAPGFDGKVTKRMMTRKSLSARVRSRREICDESWGLGCKDGYRGVVSLGPNVSKETTPTVASLRPTLTWQATAGAGVRYDIVVYEAINYLGSRKLQGRVVDYAEGLQGASYRLPRALKPKTTYYWTVRLRRGDTVSGWTRFGYTGFYGLRYTRRMANLYAFETPG